ncbi:S8 family serine peptidase [Albidovulum sediminicola]|nr:S8 family serine peptidase [Defluviimonas sp. WL0075]
MTERPILPLPIREISAQRIKGSPSKMPRPRGAAGGRAVQARRFEQEFSRLDQAFQGEDASVALRADPAGIAPERAMVFVSAVPIADLIRVAREAGIEVLAEVDLDEDYDIPADMKVDGSQFANPTLYATMPTEGSLQTLSRLWRAYRRGEKLPDGQTPWRNLFDLLAELRPWGPPDRLTVEAREIIRDRLPFDDEESVRLELEIWPTRNEDRRKRWRREAQARVEAFGGEIIARSMISETDFVYDALLASMPAGAVREMLDNPAAPEGLATLDGLQFILPQTIAQSIPLESEVGDEQAAHKHSDHPAFEFDPDLPARALLLDGTPIAAHPDLNDGVEIEDIHDLVRMSQVRHRRHATSMSSLILRGDLGTDGTPASDSRLLSIPVLVDNESSAVSPDDRLFVDVVHTSLVRAFDGQSPIAPDAFVVNLSIGVMNGHFNGRLSALARLLDWWAYRAGVLFVVSAGNVADVLTVSGINATAFEDATIEKRQELVNEARRAQRHRRTLLAPAEAMNVLTVGAASVSNAALGAASLPTGVLSVHDSETVVPAFSSAAGPGAYRSIKPDVLAVGGRHDVRISSSGGDLNLRVANALPASGLLVAAPPQSAPATRARAWACGTSCAAALTTRSILQSAAALTGPDGAYEGQELPRRDMALLTRALTVHAARWPESALDLRRSQMEAGQHHEHAGAEVLSGYGYGLVNESFMNEAPPKGATLVGLGTVRKDGARIFEMPLPQSMSNDRVHRSLLVTLSWFSPVDVSRARYRLARIEAIAADDGDEPDNEWRLKMKGDAPTTNAIGKGTVWSRRLTHARVLVPSFGADAILPIRVQCSDSSGGGLSPDDDIRFAIAVTLQLAIDTRYDIQTEIENRLRVRQAQ